MGKKSKHTPRSRIRAALRNLWLRSRERADALKLSGKRCAHCGVKETRAKGREVVLNVHHTDGIDWEGIIDLIAERILQDETKYTVLCKGCHDQEHKMEKIRELIG